MAENYIVEVTPETTVVEVSPLQVDIIIAEVGGTIGAAIPDPTGHDGEFLTTDGTDVSWGVVPDPHDPVTAGDGIDVTGQVVTNTDRGSTAVSTHEGTYDHTLIATALQAETDPDFNAWLIATPPAYPADIPTTPGEVGAEPALGNPAASGYVLSSTDVGVRSWIAMTSGVTDHGALTGLTDDDHTGYARLAGRGSVQYLYGSSQAYGNLYLLSTSDANGGFVSVGNLIYANQNSGKVGLGTTLPAYSFDIHMGLTTEGAQIGLTSQELTVVANDVLGKITFAAPDESSGGDSRLAGASITALAEGTFTSTANPTSLIFATASSEAAAEKMRIDSNGHLGIGTAVPASKLHAIDTLSAATGNEIAYQLNYTTNKLTSGDDTGLVIHQTDTASPGISKLLDLLVNNNTQCSIDNTGSIKLNGSLGIQSSSDATKYTYIDGGANAADITYLLPTTSTDGVLTNTSGQLSWGTVATESDPIFSQWLDDTVDDITFADFVTAIGGSTLVANRIYRITDFQTDYTIRGTTDQFVDLYGITEVLRVTATSTNTYNPIVKSESYPQDIIEWTHTAEAFGQILYREDPTMQVKTDFDWRVAKFRRWENWTSSYTNPQDAFTGVGINDLTLSGTFSNNGADLNFRVEIDGVDTFKWSDDGGVTWDETGLSCGTPYVLSYGITLTFPTGTGYTLGDYWDFTASYAGDGTYKWYSDTSNGNGALYEDYLCLDPFFNLESISITGQGYNTNIVCKNDVLDVNFVDCQDCHFGGFLQSVRATSLQDSIFVAGVESTIFEIYCQYIYSFGSQINGSVFGYACSRFTFYGGVDICEFGAYGQNNTFMTNVELSTFGSYFRDNYFAAFCSNNTVGNEFRNNTITGDFTNNIIGNQFGSGGANTFDSTVTYNLIHIPFNNQTIVGDYSYKELFNTTTGHDHDGVNSKSIVPIFSTDVEITNNAAGYILASTTPASTKRFRISVDDTGALTTTEIV